MAVNPTGVELKALLCEDPGGPVVMLNLLRFTSGGRELYDQYAKHTDPFLAKYGGEVLYAGEGSTVLVGEDGQSWDAVAVVRYPSRQAFCAMIADPAYQEGTDLRTRALVEAVLQATIPKI